MSVNVDANIAETADLYGKSVSDLQEDIIVSADGVSGTLKYIDDYSDAGFTGDDASGNFLALKITTPGVEGATITAELSDSTGDPLIPDPNGIVIFRIADKDTQTIEVVASKEGLGEDSVTLDLSDLTLEETPADS